MDSHGHMAASQALDEDQPQMLYNALSSHATWRNLSAPSLLKRTRLNGDDLHPCISFEPMVEDEESHRMIVPNFSYKYTYSSTM